MNAIYGNFYTSINYIKQIFISSELTVHKLRNVCIRQVYHSTRHVRMVLERYCGLMATGRFAIACNGTRADVTARLAVTINFRSR